MSICFISALCYGYGLSVYCVDLIHLCLASPVIMRQLISRTVRATVDMLDTLSRACKFSRDPLPCPTLCVNFIRSHVDCDMTWGNRWVCDLFNIIPFIVLWKIYRAFISGVRFIGIYTKYISSNSSYLATTPRSSKRAAGNTKWSDLNQH